MFNLSAFQAHLTENENLPHISKYHRESCQKMLNKHGVELEVDDGFIIDLMPLHNADDAGSVRNDEYLEEAKKNCKYAADVLLYVLQSFTSAT